MTASLPVLRTSAVALALLLCVPAARGECLPHYKPEQLVLYADAVVLATQVSPTELQIDKVLAGACKAKKLTVPALSEFRKEPPQPDPKGLVVTNKCVAFLHVRRGKGGIIANGLYRIELDRSVLGYAQNQNPGGYELQPQPLYPSLDPLLKAVDAGKALLPKEQQRLMRLAAAEERFDLRAQHLDELLRITHPGDKHVLDFIAREMARGEERAQSYLFFLQNGPDPDAAFPVLRTYFEKTDDLSLLYTIGRQGSPAALPYLEGLARKQGNNERQRFALAGLPELYQTLDRREDATAAAKVRDTIFALYDGMPLAANWAAGHPRFLGVIPEQGAVKRLEQLLARVRGDGTNREHEIQRALAECRREIERRRR
jgi:hypothetical protein